MGELDALSRTVGQIEGRMIGLERKVADNCQAQRATWQAASAARQEAQTARAEVTALSAQVATLPAIDILLDLEPRLTALETLRRDVSRWGRRAKWPLALLVGLLLQLPREDVGKVVVALIQGMAGLQ